MGTSDSWFHDPVTERGNGPAASFGVAGLAASLHRMIWRSSLALACLTSAAIAQSSENRVPVQYSDMEDSAEVMFKSPADSIEWERSRRVAARATGLRVVVSLRERRVWVLRDADTLRVAKAAVASGMTINFAGRSWTFRTPRVACREDVGD